MKAAHIKIHGKKIKVYRMEGLIRLTGSMGEFWPDEERFLIDSKLDAQHFEGTKIHEGVHALCHLIGISQAIDHGVEEILCESVKHFIMDNLDYKWKK